MAHSSRGKAISRGNRQRAAFAGSSAGTKKPVKKNGHAQRQRAKQANGLGAIKEHQAGSRRAKAGAQLGPSLSLARPEASGAPGLGIREAKKSLVRPRMLLASTFGHEMRASAIAEVPIGVLASKAREQSTQGSTKSY